MRSSKRIAVLLWRLAADRPERSLQSQDLPPARRAPINRRRARYLAPGRLLLRDVLSRLLSPLSPAVLVRASALIAARGVEQTAPLGILFRGEVFQGDGLLFAAGWLFRFHGDSVFLFLWL